MPTDDYYSILNIQRDASKNEIKKAYRILAKKFHPDSADSVDGSAEVFTKINEAYTVLSDSDEKRKYDAAFSGSESQSNRDGNRSSREARYSSRFEASAKRSRDTGRIWREGNATFKSGSFFFNGKSTTQHNTYSRSSKPFQAYRRKRKYSFFLGAFLAAIIIFSLFLVLFYPSFNLRNTGRNYNRNFVENIGNAPPSFSGNRKNANRQIRKELYSELIVNPEIEKRIARSLKNSFKQNLDSSSIKAKQGMLFQPDQSKNLADEIWEDVQDPVHVP